MFEIKPIFSSLLRQKTRSLLIIIQVAITIAIVSNALHSINERRVRMTEPTGVMEDVIISFSVDHISNKENFRSQYPLDEDHLRSKPGVVNASITSMIPLGNNSNATTFQNIPFDGNDTHAQRVGAGYFEVSEHFLDAMGVSITEGRDFTAEEISWGGSQYVAMPIIVTQGFADAMFPEGDALGKPIYAFKDSALTIIGIVDKLSNAYTHRPELLEKSIFVPVIPMDTSRTFVIRTSADNIENIRNNAADWMREVNANRVIRDVRTLSEVRDAAYHDDKAMIKVLSVVVSALLFITALAIVGMTSFSINQRTKQIGTRRALGATRLDIVRYFIVENWILSFVGIAIGISLSISLNVKLMQKFGVEPLTSIFLLVTILVILLLGFISVILPALRASQISPSIATRTV